MKIPDVKPFESDESLILAGLATNEEFIKKLAPLPVVKLLESDHAKMLAGMCFKYFRDHGKAPGDTIIDLLARTKRKPATIKDMAAVLENINNVYLEQGKDLDLPYALKIAERYLNQRNIENRRDEENNLAANYEDDKIWQLKPLQKINLTQDEVAKGPSFNEALLGENSLAMSFMDFEELDHPPKEYLMVGNFPLEKASISIFSGVTGGGKTWFTQELCKIMAGAEAGLAGLIHADVQRKICYVDGELPAHEILDRSKALELNRFPNLIVLSKSLLERNNVSPSMNLTDANVQKTLTDYLVANEFELVIFDNLYSLFGIEDLNNGSDWQPVNDWFLKLRAKNIAVILIHHQNKAGVQFGTITKTWNVNNVLELKKETPKDGDIDCACFSISVSKQRGQGIHLSGLKYIFRNDVWSTEGKKATDSPVRRAAILKLLAENKHKGVEIADMTYCTKENVSQAKTWFLGKGECLKEKGKTLSLTKTGDKFLEEHFKEDFKEILKKEYQEKD